MMVSRLRYIEVLLLILFSLLTSPCAAEALPNLQRGINLNRPFLEVRPDPSFPGEMSFVEWDEKTIDSVLERLKLDGFLSIRLLVKLDPLLSTQSHRLKEQEILINFVQRCSDAGFAIVVALYAPDLFATDPQQGPDKGDKFLRFIEATSSLAAKLGLLRNKNVAFEPVNEPPPPCVWSKEPNWSAIQSSIFAAVRRAAPRLAVVVTGACWGGIDGLLEVNPRDFDKFTIYSFHFYEPYLFTHQSIEYEKGVVRYISHLDYPAQPGQRGDILAQFFQSTRITGNSDAGNKQFAQEGIKEIERYFLVEGNAKFIAKRFALVRAWAKRNNLPSDRIFLGEFGVTGGADPSRSEMPQVESKEWLREVRTEAEKLGCGWAVYSLIGTFGVKNRVNGPIFENGAYALGLKF